MKKPFLKRVIGPMLVLILGSMGAIGTMSMASSPTASGDQVGYRFVNELHPCQKDIMCSTIVDDVCKTPSLEILWGKVNETDAECPLPLYKKQ